MLIKSIYHSPHASYGLCKELGFTHVNIPLWTFTNVEQAIISADQARAIGLHCIITPGKDDLSDLKEFFYKALYCPSCIAYLWDEPNLKGIPAKKIKDQTAWFHDQGILTMTVLSPIRSYWGYEDCVDFMGFDYYKEFNLWRKLKLFAKVKEFKDNSPSQFFAVPAVKPGQIQKQFNFWRKWLGMKSFYWYQFFPTQERPRWHDKDVDADESLQAELKKANES